MCDVSYKSFSVFSMKRNIGEVISDELARSEQIDKEQKQHYFYLTIGAKKLVASSIDFVNNINT